MNAAEIAVGATEVERDAIGRDRSGAGAKPRTRRSQEELLAGLASRQHGVVARAQLREIGMTVAQIDYRVKCRSLIRMYESVYRVASHASDWRQSLLGACWAGGLQRQSVGSHRASLALSGLPGGLEIVEITSPRHRRARHTGVVTHESLILEERDIRYVDNIPITRAARTLCDSAALVVTREMPVATLELAIAEAIRLHLVDRASLAVEWKRLGGLKRPGSQLMEQLIDRAAEPTRPQQSTPESMALIAIRCAGLPEPVTQHRVWVSATQYFDLDLAWPEFRYAWEVSPWWFHGGTRRRHDRDAQRRLELRRVGWDYDVATDAEIDNGFPIILDILRHRVGGASIDPEN